MQKPGSKSNETPEPSRRFEPLSREEWDEVLEAFDRRHADVEAWRMERNASKPEDDQPA